MLTTWAVDARHLTLASEFVRRELRNRFSASFSGGLWALIQPVVQLAVYSLVFVHVFKARLPGADAPGFVPFLVTALWPWTAFSEALLRSVTAIHDNAGLIGKVALPRWVLVFAPTCASFLVHGTGFVAIVIALRLLGYDVRLGGLLSSLLLFVPMFALVFGLASILAAAQVFVRDLAQVLGQLLLLLMFAAPIFYARESIPEQYRGWLDLNPFTFYAESFRSLLLGYGHIEVAPSLAAIALALVVLVVGVAVFRRLDRHFEDFL
ncbi:MAG: hypothetical protein DI564_07975 [Rhodanobacter denitrificans]|uniref:Transport permease protein n=1 Tax=Rhodanobacter denitrificans TaxID=666685 RepID=A0A2W5MGB3_9GAMM|nr:MAG: hypothetical protein DI564_07975 [Rhodanobacter denitrificans]